MCKKMNLRIVSQAWPAPCNRLVMIILLIYWYTIFLSPWSVHGFLIGSRSVLSFFTLRFVFIAVDFASVIFFLRQTLKRLYTINDNSIHIDTTRMVCSLTPSRYQNQHMVIGEVTTPKHKITVVDMLNALALTYIPT